MREVKAHSANQHGSTDKNSAGSTFFAAQNQNSVLEENIHDRPLQAKAILSDRPTFFQPIQTKLSIGKPGDKYEKEADAVADQVVSKTVSQTSQTATDTPVTAKPTAVQHKTNDEVHRKEDSEEIQEKPISDTITPLLQMASDDENTVQQKCAECAAEDEKRVQRRSLTDVQQKGTGNQSTSAGFEKNLGNSKGGGSPMSEATRSEMESGFGSNFSNVRIHTDSNAVQMNKSLGSQAFTNGSDVYFNEGKYNPSSKDGKHLLAHELTHTVQQGASPKGIQQQNQSVEGEEGAVQMQLEVNAERLHEARIINDNTVSSATNNAAQEANEEPQDGNAENENAEDLSTQADAGSENDENVNENSNDSNAGQGGDVTIENNGNNQGNCEPECFREPTEEPEEEPDEEPENPEPAQVEAEGDDGGQDDVWEEIDDCPTEQAEATGASVEPSEGESVEGAPAATTEGNPDQENANPKNKESDADLGGGKNNKAAASSSNELEGIISSAEGERSISVAAYQASSASLSNTASKNEAVKGQVSFVPNPSENTKQNTRRQQATSRANDFFSSIGNRLAEATAFGLEDIPHRIGTTAETAKAQISASMEAQKSVISARIALARGEARVKAAATRMAVHSQATNYISDVEALTATAIETLNTTYTDTMTNIGDLETTTLDMINGMYVEGRTKLINLGPTIGNECRETANTMANQYEGFRNCTEDGFWDGNLSERRANAQAEAARSVGQTYFDRMVDSAREQAIEVTKNGRKVDRCAIIASANQSRSTLDTSLPQLISALESTRDAAIEQARATESSLIAGIDASLTSTLDQLDEQEYTQRKAINDTGYMQQVMQESIAHAAAAATQQGIQSAVSSVQNSLMELKTQFSSKQAPDPQELENTLSQVQQNINTAVDGLFNSADTGISTAEAQLNNNLQQALASLQGITQSNEETATKVMGDFNAGMNGISGVDNFAAQRISFTTQVQQSVDSSVAALVQAFDGFQQSCDGTIEQATTRLAEAEVNLDENLRQNQQGLECEITASADEAASKEAPAWKRFLAVLIIILVVIIIIAVTVLTAGAGGAVLITALGGPLMAGMIIGAVVGAVVSGLITMAVNLWTNQDVMKGVGDAMLKGALVGAAGGLIGAAAGLGAGVLFQTATKGVQVAAQFGAAMISGGGFDIITQYIEGGFSFDKFSWGQLGFTLFITAITFGIGHAAGSRANAGGVIDGPDAHPVMDSPDANPVIDTPEANPIVDTPESTPVVDTPESNPVVDGPESTPVTDGPENTPVNDGPENTPVNDGTENTPVNDADADATPVNDGPETTPNANETGADQARNLGYPDAPEGHHWRKGPNGEPILVKNSSHEGPKLELDPETNSFRPVNETGPQGNAALKERVTPRESTRQEIRAQQIEDGHFTIVDGELHLTDPNTGEIIPNYPEFYPSGHPKAGQPHPKAGEPMGDIGHKPGHAWNQYQNDPSNATKTRTQVIEDQNDPNIYYFEDPSSNRSHQFE